MLRHMGADKLLNVFFAQSDALFQYDARHDFLAVLRVRHADNLNVAHLLVGVDEVLDLLRVDILAAADNHIFDPPGDAVVAVAPPPREVAGVQPAVRVDGGGGGGRHFIITLHDVVAPRHELSVGVVGEVFAGSRIDNLAFDAGQRLPHRADAHLHRVVGTAHCAARRRFGLSEHDGNLAHPHFLQNVLHHLDRAGTARHNAGAHMRKVGGGEQLMLQHRDKHGRHAVYGGNLLFVNRLQRQTGRVSRYRNHRRAVGDAGGHRQHHPEAVEHRHMNQKAVGCREIHTVADIFAVVDDVVMAQHHAFGEAGRAGGVLHVADVVAVQHRGALVYLLQRRVFRHRHRVVPVDTTGQS